MACQLGRDDVVHDLLAIGQRDCARNDGATALFKAAHKGFSRIVDELISMGANKGILQV